MEDLKQCCFYLNVFITDRCSPNGNKKYARYILKLHKKKTKQVLAFQRFQPVEVTKHKAYEIT